MRNISKRELRSFNPYRPFDQFFTNNLNNFWAGDSFMESPAFNIIETEKKYMIELAAPGLEKKDFQIEIKDQILTIKVQKENEVIHTQEDSEPKYIKKEFSFHQFSKSFTLDNTISQDEIEASYFNGILAVSLQKNTNNDIVKKVDIK